MIQKVESHVAKLPTDQFVKNQKADDNACSTCCKVIALAIAVFVSIALFTFLAPIPALVITACLLVGTGSLWVVPVTPVVNRGWGYQATPLRHTTIPVLPGRGPAFQATPVGGHTAFGGGHTVFGGGMRSAGPTFGGGMRSATLGGGGGRTVGGRVAFGGG